MVECYWPGIEQDADAALRRVSRLTGLAGNGGVAALGCIIVPSDGLALFLFRAPSEASVRSMSELAEVPFDRVVESINIGLDG